MTHGIRLSGEGTCIAQMPFNQLDVVIILRYMSSSFLDRYVSPRDSRRTKDLGGKVASAD